jgi:hypothetical protein
VVDIRRLLTGKQRRMYPKLQSFMIRTMEMKTKGAAATTADLSNRFPFRT